MRTPSIYSQDDPLTAALQPDPGETDNERRMRVFREAEAKRISEQIDEDIRQERERMKRSKGDVKLLLLGQAESGKSTLQKQFQLMYRPHSIDQERSSWRTVIYYNVVHSLRHIMTSLEQFEEGSENAPLDDGASVYSRYPNGTESSPSTSFTKPSSLNGYASSTHQAPLSPSTPPPISGKDPRMAQIAYLRRRLAPLISTDAALADRLSGGINVSGPGKGGVLVRSGWQARTIENALNKTKWARRMSSEGKPVERDSFDIVHDSLVLEVGRMLDICKEDIKALWSHPLVKMLISKRKLKLDEWSEFFLKHISRVAAADYLPTIDDILHARVQTMGVAEHVFDVNIHGKSVTWHLFDVGGARGQRHSWVPYFDDANAIIFVAPVSAFDQYLEEDPRTNRIDDSLQLFTQICSNALLKSVHLVLFLNKTDLLKAKLDAGLRVSKYITSFGNRSNDYETAVQYFRAHFLQVHRRNNENRRVLYTHFTSVVDTKATQRIIGNVRDSIFRGYLQSAALV
ncbi:G-alpha-domain-containing protein [Schizophyllum commune H4-8]|uniref:Guanine nucleotide-binding protein alpha-4 subunit n=1 Tax=Schizophyllum commune (strain H4-8 / FGSC 9210) TaxID=578458 RepID=D8Q3S8_SCHCM|nr:G-alpha-domain-containing protein [Schizophyllum commune H4-8]KAI5892909.1 G-alpha-domain-containing protein [Schizophyllum commune H4-8]